MPQVLEKLVSGLTRRFPGLIIAGHCAPPFRPLSDEEDAADVAAINVSRPDYAWIWFWVCRSRRNGWCRMWGASRRPRCWASALLSISTPVPSRVLRAGCSDRASNWPFRLATEPRRLAHRYLIDNFGLSGTHNSTIGRPEVLPTGTGRQDLAMKLLISAMPALLTVVLNTRLDGTGRRKPTDSGHQVWALALPAHRQAINEQPVSLTPNSPV